MALTYRVPDLLPEPFRNGGPPSDVSTDGDVSVFKTIRNSYPALTMCVTYGAEAVATYQFNCRAPFTVGRTTYLLPTTSYEEYQRNLEGYNDLITGRMIMGVQRVLEGIFTEYEMLALHRVHLEMQYSNPVDQVRPAPTMLVSATTQSPFSIRNMEEEGGTNITLTQPRESTFNNLSGTDLEPVPVSVIYPQGMASNGTPSDNQPRRFGHGEGDSLLSYANRTGRIDYGWLDESRFFWTAPFNSSYAEGQHISNNEMNDVGDQTMTEAPEGLSPTNNTVIVSSNGDDTSSTGSSGDLCIITDFEAQHNQAILPLQPHVNEVARGASYVTGPGNPEHGENLDLVPSHTQTETVAGSEAIVSGQGITEHGSKYPPPEPETMESDMGQASNNNQPQKADLILRLGCVGNANQGAMFADTDEGGSSSEGSRTVGGF